MFVTQQDIEAITSYRNKKGAISLYIYSAPQERAADFETRLNSLSNIVKREAAKANGHEWAALYKKFKALQEELQNNFLLKKGSTHCLFLGCDFFKYVEIPARLKETITILDQFYTVPLLSLLSQFERYAVLVFSRNKARLFSYFLEKMQEETSIVHDYVLPNFNPSAGAWKALKEKTIANKIENTFHRHLKEISQWLFKNFSFYRFDKVILASHQEELQLIEDYLHPYIAKKIVAEFVADVNESEEVIAKKLKKALDRYRKQKEIEKINRLLNLFSHKKAVLGLNLVIDAFMRGNVREVVLNNDFHSQGYICPQKHFMVAGKGRKGKCIYCGTLLRPEPFLEEEIVEEAYVQKAGIFNIVQAKEQFKKYKIGAVLRF